MTKKTIHTYPCHLLAILTIGLLCGIIYSNTLNSPFIFDDTLNIEDNAYIRISELNLKTLYKAGFKSPSSRRPLANISFAVNYFFGKYEVIGYHIINILIHLINGILVYFLSIAMFKQMLSSKTVNSPVLKYSNFNIVYISLFAALIFISHPIQIQSVTYLVQRMNSMATMFYLLSFLLYLHGRINRLRWRRYALWTGGFVSWILALGTKEIAATLPLAIFFYEWYFFQNLSYIWLKNNYKHIVLALVLITSVYVMYLGKLPFDEFFGNYAGRDFTPWQRVLTQFRVIVFYISLLFYPHPSRLNLLHHIIPSDSFVDPFTTLLSFFVLAFLICLMLALARRQRIISFCILWFFLHLLIESSVIGLEMIFEHRLYLPMVGFSLLLAYFLFSVLAKKRLWVSIICILVICMLSVATYTRNGIWHDSETFWSDVLSKNPHSHRAHNNLGIFLDKQGRQNEAIYHYSEALRIKPDHAEAHNNLGVVFEQQKRFTDAIYHYNTALQIRPEYIEAHNNLGVALEQQGHFKDAIDHYFMALNLQPNYIDACINLGVALMRQGNLEGAVRSFHAALQIDPDNAGIYNNLGVAVERQGKSEKALEYYKKALRLKPDYAEAHNNLGIMLIRHGLYDEAIGHFSEALRIDPEDEETKHNLELGLQKMKKDSPLRSLPGP